MLGKLAASAAGAPQRVAMWPRDSHTIRWSGLRSGTAPATWGQEYMHDVLRSLRPDSHILNQVRVVALTGACGTEDVLRALRTLIARHDSLRVSFSCDDHGVLRQHLVAAAGTPVDCWHAQDAGEETELLDHLRRRLGDPPFTPADARHFRVAVVTRAGRPSAVVWAASHVICDAASARVINRELGHLLEAPVPPQGAEPAATARQPFEQADLEQSARGRHINARALAYWEERLRSMPPGWPGRTARPPETPRFCQGALTSTAAKLCCDALATALRVSTSSVLLAATAHALAQLLGTSRVVLQTTAGNRAERAVVGTVGNLAQTGVAVIDVDRSSFAETVRRAWIAGVQAYGHSHFRFRDLNQLIDAVARDRGEKVDLAFFFNDARVDNRADPAALGTSVEALRTSAQASAFRWREGLTRQNISLLLVVTSAPDAYVLSVLADTTTFAPAEVEGTVAEIERVLLDAAAFAQVTRETG